MAPSVPRFRKLPPRYAAVVLPLVLTAIMTFIVSGISTLGALGPSAEALRVWPLSWAVSWAVAFPTMLVVLPVARRIVALLVAAP